jgi:hypothetical protein
MAKLWGAVSEHLLGPPWNTALRRRRKPRTVTKAPRSCRSSFRRSRSSLGIKDGDRGNHGVRRGGDGGGREKQKMALESCCRSMAKSGSPSQNIEIFQKHRVKSAQFLPRDGGSVTKSVELKT